MSAKTTALTLAAIKALKDHLTKIETRQKDALMEELDPGDRKVAKLDDGTSLATISVSQREAAWGVHDEAAFLKWVKKHRPTAIVERVRESDQKSILEAIATTGEIPDGVDLGDPGNPYVSVKQTPTQQAAVVAAWRAGTLDLPDPLAEIEAPS